MDKRIVIYENHENDFYAKMGMYFANRRYAQEMGGWQFYTKDNAIWFLLEVDNALVGFCSIIIEKTHIFFDNFYILKEHRGNKYSNLLFDKRLEYAKNMNKQIRLICDNPIQINRYTKYGFKHIGFRGHYHKFIYESEN